MAEMAVALVAECPDCGSRLRIRRRRSDRSRFLGCSAWPGCHFTADYDHALEDVWREIESLRAEIRGMRRRERQSPRGEVKGADLVRRELRELLFQLHPDRNPEGLDATQVTAVLSALRDRL